ncbi:hypothetical protein RvY_04555 [Ramazzottius varieornatus]|uniref:IPT/TIG domain-containing protein n=1 Tax=Ramazzottius varieornatus TaxID=947166 RepID=A0A1D1URZ4_RAMVA|nr:hypothetical protein RvY_04555 [Ramazzottius varieornatus]
MDLEAAVDPLKDDAPKKREPFVRLVFDSLTTVQNLDGSTRTITLQVSSTPICCRAPVGTPEIFRMCHGKWPACGGTEVILLGRKFVRSESQLFVQEVDETGIVHITTHTNITLPTLSTVYSTKLRLAANEEQILWQQEVAISHENFSSVHLVWSTPTRMELLAGYARTL